MKRVDQRWRVNIRPSFSWYGWKNNHRRTSRTPPSSIFTNGKGTNRHAIITAESPYFQFFGKILSRVLLNCLNTNTDSYQRVNAASVRNVELLTWCLLQGSSKRSVRNRALTSTRLMLISQKKIKKNNNIMKERSPYIPSYLAQLPGPAEYTDCISTECLGYNT